MSLKPICVPCQRFYRPKTNGVHFIEGMPAAGAGPVRPGKADSHLWRPYKLWQGDLWACPGCGAEIIVGCAQKPLAEHYMPDFQKAVEDTQAILKINDC